VYGYGSVHETLTAEDALKRAGVAATTIPSPRALGELCGIALRVTPEDAEAAEDALAAAGAHPRARAEIQDI
jgi:hypothetical protein